MFLPLLALYGATKCTTLNTGSTSKFKPYAVRSFYVVTENVKQAGVVIKEQKATGQKESTALSLYRSGFAPEGDILTGQRSEWQGVRTSPPVVFRSAFLPP